MNETCQNKIKTSFWQKVVLMFLGVVLTLFFLEIGLRVGGFILLTLQEHRNKVSIRQKGAYRILCLGESTTATGGDNSYPSQLQKILNKSNIGLKFSVINKGVWATTIAAIASQLDYNLDRYSPDMVITMIGINDERFHLLQYDPNFSNSKNTNFINGLRIVRLVNFLTSSLTNMIQKTERRFIKQNKEVAGYSYKTVMLPVNQNSQAVNASYVSEGYEYREVGKFTDAEESFKKAIEMNPCDESAYFGLSWMYDYLGKQKEAEEMFLKCIEVNPNSDRAYIGLGNLYSRKGLFNNAENMFKKAIEINPDEGNYIELGWFYQKTGQINKALQILESFQTSDKSDIFYAALGAVYKKKGDYRLAKYYLDKAEDIRNRSHLVNIYTNYKNIVDKVLKRKIRLICVQYPVRSITPLKKMLEGYDGIIFVDNEKIFKDAIANYRYDEFFCDYYGGDFGHCTEKGNRLLAENVANVILKEVFGK